MLTQQHALGESGASSSAETVNVIIFPENNNSVLKFSENIEAMSRVGELE